MPNPRFTLSHFALLAFAIFCSASVTLLAEPSQKERFTFYIWQFNDGPITKSQLK